LVRQGRGSESAWLKALYKQQNVCGKKFTLVSGSALAALGSNLQNQEKAEKEKGELCSQAKAPSRG
jgi:hypothetical protein